MKKKIALKVKNLTVRYKSLKNFSVKRNLLKFNKRKHSSFEALTNVSFELEEGKILGIIGTNGAGKSTLLRTIAGIFSPDEGEIDLCGNSVSLQAIGVGFQNRLSGYENIYLSGLLLGFTKDEIKAKEKDIIEFADIGDFIYKPVRTYSSGMRSKLAFAITATLETDIMLIDEILSVGDAAFRKKSYAKMKELIMDDTRTVLIVSHNTNSLKELCDDVIWLEKGKVIEYGKADEVIDKYLDYIENKKKK